MKPETLDIPALRPPLATVHVTSPFGLRTSPLTGKPEGHPGADFRAPEGTPVFAVADGVVVKSYLSEGKEKNPALTWWGYGNSIVLSLPGGWTVRYAHLADRCVFAGKEVRAGELIGHAGNTGASKGAHLHLELHRPDGAAVDPMPAIKAV